MHHKGFFLKEFEVEITIWVDSLYLLHDLNMVGKIVHLDYYAQIIVMQCKSNVASLIERYIGIILISKVVIKDNKNG